MAAIVFSRGVKWLSAAVFGGALLAGCGGPGPATGEVTPPDNSAKPPPPKPDDPIFDPNAPNVKCDA
ncbi:MAG: hypothetical protein L6Q76_30755, partial [Polyangiaceae bacterium]|nr:hypothetical protein [Polyangiaceae bacterium]